MAELSINLVTKYRPVIEERFKLGSLVWGKAKAKYEFTGAKTVKTLTPKTLELNDYNPEATGSRFGTLKEIEDDENIYTVTQNKSFNGSIDKSFNTNQLMIKESGKMLKMEVDEVVIPHKDKYALGVYVKETGIEKSVDGTLTKDNIVEKMIAANTAMVNNKVPTDNLILWVKATHYGLLQNSSQFINLRGLGEKSIGKGVVGEVSGMKVVRLPDSYFPTNVNFIVAEPKVLMNVDKINTLRILKEHPDVDGAVIQGHFMFDAFVLRQRAKGVYVSLEKEQTV